MKFFQIIFLLFLSTCLVECKGQTTSQKNSTYISIDLSLDSIVNISIDNIKTSKDTIALCFPNTLLGTYHLIPNQITNFKAFDKVGDKMKIVTSTNKYYIIGSKKLDNISYTVEATEASSINILSSGVVIDSSIIVLNNNILFGNQQNKNSYFVKVKKKAGYNNISNNNVQKESEFIDVIRFKNYYELVNSPIIYSKYSTTESFIVDSVNVNISVHSPNSFVNACIVSSNIKPVVFEIFKKIDFIPKGNYNLVFIYNNQVNSNIFTESALEHPASSVYYFFSEPSFVNRVDSLSYFNGLKQLVAHELLHLFTPISFRDDFDKFFYSDSISMSEHLWLYEGFVEYLSFKSLLDADIISQSFFFNKFEEKINKYSRYEKMGYKRSLLSVSKEIYEGNNLNIFYNRAAVVCFLLDIEILRITNGNESLFTTIKSTYLKNKTLNKDSLFIKMNEIAPGINQFINIYIKGEEFPDLNLYLNYIGLKYNLKRKEYGYYFPIKIINSNSTKKTATVVFNESINPFSGEDTVEIVKINDLPITSYSLSLMYKKYFKTNNTFKIEYKSKNNIIKTTYVKPIKAQVPSIPYYPNITINNEMTTSQRELYNLFFK